MYIHLSHDLWKIIINQVLPEDLMRLAEVCKNLYALTREPLASIQATGRQAVAAFRLLANDYTLTCSYSEYGSRGAITLDVSNKELMIFYLNAGKFHYMPGYPIPDEDGNLIAKKAFKVTLTFGTVLSYPVGALHEFRRPILSIKPIFSDGTLFTIEEQRAIAIAGKLAVKAIRKNSKARQKQSFLDAFLATRNLECQIV